jgi:hypothetical protein
MSTVLVGLSERKEHLSDLGADGEIILTWILERMGMRFLLDSTGSLYERMTSLSGHGMGFGFHTNGEFRE